MLEGNIVSPQLKAFLEFEAERLKIPVRFEERDISGVLEEVAERKILVYANNAGDRRELRFIMKGGVLCPDGLISKR